MEITKLES